MAASGAMADFARMPTQRKALVFVVIGAALGLLYYQFIYQSLKSDLAKTRTENTTKAALDRKLAADIPDYEKLKSRMKELTQLISENQKALPTEAEVPAFFETLERKITESGVEITKWKKNKEEPVETFVKVPVEIEMSGTFMQIKRFFASLVQKDVAPALDDGQVEERERIIAIENLALTAPVVRNREIHLTAKFVAVTFRQEDVKEVKDPKAKPGAAPSNAPPMPGAGTPQGAKVRTEDALKKGETVNRNATNVDEAKTPAGDGSAKLKGGI